MVFCPGVAFTSSWGGQLSAPAGSESYTRTEDHPILPTGQLPSKQKELYVISILGPQKGRFTKSSLVLRLA
jgi:hypothetical protein